MHTNHTIDETSKILKISNAMLYKLWRLGKGPKVIKIGRRTLVSSKAIEDFLKEMEQN